MDLSKGLITKIIDEGRINEVRRSGITDGFLDNEYRPVFNYLFRHYKEYGDIPSRTAVQRAFPNFEFANYKEPLEYFLDSVKEGLRRSILDDALHDVAKVYHKNTVEAESLLRDSLKNLQITQKTFLDVDLAATALESIDAYEQRKLNPGVTGIRSNWQKMDYQTLGWQPEEFIVIVGEKYIGKSWIMAYLAYQAMMEGERVLFVTSEMAQGAIKRRLQAIYANISFDSLRRGELTDEEENRYKQRMGELSESNYKFVIARNGVNTIDDIEAKAVECDSTIIFADSVYLFSPDTSSKHQNETQKRINVSQKCKSIAKQLGIPFVVSVQAGRKQTKDRKPDLDNIEWSNAFSQDADTVFELYKDDIDRELNRMQIWLLKCREGNITNFFIENDFEYMNFSQRDDETEPTTNIDFDDDDQLAYG